MNGWEYAFDMICAYFLLQFWTAVYWSRHP